MDFQSNDPKDVKTKNNGDEVVDLAAFRAKKEMEQHFGQGRKPLYVSHLTGRLTGSPHMQRPGSEDFGERVQRIKVSLEKINRLLAEIKKISLSSNKNKNEGLEKGSMVTKPN